MMSEDEDQEIPIGESENYMKANADSSGNPTSNPPSSATKDGLLYRCTQACSLAYHTSSEASLQVQARALNFEVYAADLSPIGCVAVIDQTTQTLMVSYRGTNHTYLSSYLVDLAIALVSEQDDLTKASSLILSDYLGYPASEQKLKQVLSVSQLFLNISSTSASNASGNTKESQSLSARLRNAGVEVLQAFTLRAVLFAHNVIARYFKDSTGTAKSVIVTGHSLGGLYAQITGHYLGLRTYTFNSPGAQAVYSDATLGLHFYCPPCTTPSTADILNFCVGDDAIGKLGKALGDRQILTFAGERDVIVQETLSRESEMLISKCFDAIQQEMTKERTRYEGILQADDFPVSLPKPYLKRQAQTDRPASQQDEEYNQLLTFLHNKLQEIKQSIAAIKKESNIFSLSASALFGVGKLGEAERQEDKLVVQISACKGLQAIDRKYAKIALAFAATPIGGGVSSSPLSSITKVKAMLAVIQDLDAKKFMELNQILERKKRAIVFHEQHSIAACGRLVSEWEREEGHS